MGNKPLRSAAAVFGVVAFSILASTPMGAVGLNAPGSVGSSSDGSNELTVMTRNLYLGADVDLALGLLPELAAAAQAMWTQVAATDFSRRVTALAADILERKPMVLGLQEATIWQCLNPAGEAVTIFDFTAQLLDELTRSGTQYVIAERNGALAVSPGYAIPPLPGGTVVRDPATFQSILGTDEAACGLQIADVLAVRSDVASAVTAVGIQTFDASVAIGGLLAINRGYAWADLALPGGAVRVATTHLESLWSADAEPAAAAQARQLVAELSAVDSPVVVMGDFNADPRDPRAPGEPNPAGQPEVTPFCEDRTCNPYWIMIEAGFSDAGPDPTDPMNWTWGADGLLAGPSLDRLDAARAAGNPFGFTDRFDYVFLRGDLRVIDAAMIGNQWPDSPSVWDCDDPDQVRITQQAARALEIPVPDTGRCFATDHAGVSVTVALGPEPDMSPESTTTTSTSPENASDDSTLVPDDIGDSGLGVGVVMAVVAMVAAIAAGVMVRRRR
jgi:hypothetical protein